VTPKPFRVLVVCTGNAARSILGEALLRHLGGERFAAASAGSRPAGFVHPLALEVLAEAGVDSGGAASKGVDDVLARDPRVDLVVTVCDSAAQSCPVVPGARTVHWGLDDPTAAAGDEAARRSAFRATRDALARRLARLVALSDDELRRADLVDRLAAIHGEA
jgi:arsenate reductase